MFVKSNIKQEVLPIEVYLKEQKELIEKIGDLLGKEHNCLIKKDIDGLNNIGALKSQYILKLQQNDQKLKLHPQKDKLNSEYKKDVDYIKQSLCECKYINSVNGKLINMFLASTKRLNSMMMGIRDKMCMNLTYNNQGNTDARGPLRLSIQA